MRRGPPYNEWWYLMLKRACVNLLLVITSVFLCLLLFEGTLRLGFIDNPLYKRLTPRGMTSTPRTKVLIVGDSFIYKDGNLDKKIVEGLGAYDTGVLNVGVPGMGPIDYLSALKAFGTDFKPDVIILGYYAGNDLTDVQFHRSIVEADNLKGKLKNSFRPFLHRIYGYHLFVHFRSIQELKILRSQSTLDAPGVDQQLAELALEGRDVNPFLLAMAPERKATFLADNLLMETESNRRAAARLVDILSDVNSISQSIGARLLIVIFPETTQVNHSHFEFYQKAGLTTDERTLNTAVPQELIKDAGFRLDIPVLDLLPAFRERMEQELYRDNDMHFNDEGDALAAELILSFVSPYLECTNQSAERSDC